MLTNDVVADLSVVLFPCCPLPSLRGLAIFLFLVKMLLLVLSEGFPELGLKSLAICHCFIHSWLKLSGVR